MKFSYENFILETLPPTNTPLLLHSSTPAPSPMGPPAARTRRGRIRHSALSQRNRSTPYDCPVSQSSATGSTPLVPGSPISRSNTLTPHTPASFSPTINLLNSNLISSTPSLLNSSSRLTHSQPPTIASSPRPPDTSPAISSSAPFRITSHLKSQPRRRGRPRRHLPYNNGIH